MVQHGYWFSKKAIDGILDLGYMLVMEKEGIL